MAESFDTKIELFITKLKDSIVADKGAMIDKWTEELTAAEEDATKKDSEAPLSAPTTEAPATTGGRKSLRGKHRGRHCKKSHKNHGSHRR